MRLVQTGLQGCPRAPDALRCQQTVTGKSDSLDTWVLAALAQLHHSHGYLFDVRVDDQEHTLELLRDGSVLGAVTAQGTAMQGCAVQALGAMRYQAIASPAFVARHFATGVNAQTLAQAPMIVFNRKDALQWRFIRRITRARLNPPLHYLPTATGFVDAAALGLGWCLAPESLLTSALQTGRVVCLAEHYPVDMPLYWQHASVRSATLQHLGDALRRAASSALR